jgi:repressor LexA
MSDLTKRQREVLDCIIRGVVDNGMPPTYREIGEDLDIRSTNGVSEHVNMLIRKGYIERPSSGNKADKSKDGKSKRGRGLARGLVLTNKAEALLERDVVSVPILGNVAAGQPILAEEHADEFLKFDQSITGGHRHVFALRVKGESMINEGILDGDIVLVRKQETARDGDIVVAIIDGEATVKTFFRERNRIRLQPANDTMRPIYVSSESEAGISGKVIGSFRQYR